MIANLKSPGTYTADTVNTIANLKSASTHTANMVNTGAHLRSAMEQDGSYMVNTVDREEPPIGEQESLLDSRLGWDEEGARLGLDNEGNGENVSMDDDEDEDMDIDMDEL